MIVKEKSGRILWLVLLAAITALVISQVWVRVHGNSVVQVKPEVKVAHGVYDPDAVLSAQHEIEQEIADGTFLNSDSKGLEYLAYLAEGALCFPDKVDLTRVRMLANQPLGLLESATILTDDQMNSLNRIKNAMSSLSQQMAQPTSSHRFRQ